jgi:hypothetical protein
VGFRLLFLGWWTPNYIVRRELKNISEQTTTALESLIPKTAKEEDNVNQKQNLVDSVEQQRADMAQTQAKLVETLEAAVGREEAVRLGREALFLVGQELGKQTRVKLGVSDNPKDLIKAAKILYRILGIEFHLEWLDNSNAKATIDRCVLADKYSKLSCEVLSATDEGVINGLQPKVTMKFNEYMTSGCRNCSADIHYNGEESK